LEKASASILKIEEQSKQTTNQQEADSKQLSTCLAYHED
jgi:hypothetical protein